MVCPSCGEQVTQTEASCRFCGAAIQQRVTRSPGSLPPAGGEVRPGASEKISRQRRAATASLILGIFSLASLPLLIALIYASSFRNRVLGPVIGALFFSGFPAGVLALVLGYLANRGLRRIQGSTFSDKRPRRAMILGAIGAGIWGLLVLVIPWTSPPVGHVVSAVGTLRTINTAAMTYSSKYGHGFPRRLSYLGYDPSKENDQAAGFIDQVLASGTKAGYRFYYVAGPEDNQGRILTYSVYADPVDPRAGKMHYFTDESRIIRGQANRQANVGSLPLGR